MSEPDDPPPPTTPSGPPLPAGVRSPAVAREALNHAGLHGQMQSLGGRVGAVERRVDRHDSRLGHLEGRPAVAPPPPSSRALELAARARQSDADHEHAAVLAAVVRHVDKAVGTVLENDARQDEAQAAQGAVLEAQSRALVLLGRELGVEDKLDPLLTKSLPPPPPERGAGAPATPVLRRLDRRSQLAQIVQAIIALGIIADLLRSLLFPHH